MFALVSDLCSFALFRKRIWPNSSNNMAAPNVDVCNEIYDWSIRNIIRSALHIIEKLIQNGSLHDLERLLESLN